MGGLVNILAAGLALGGFIAAALWLFTPKRRPAVRSRRGGGAVMLFIASVAAYYLASLL